MTILCTGGGSYQRWIVRNDHGGIISHHTFTSGDQLGTHSVENYHFTLISTANSRLESTFSRMVTNYLNGATVECADFSSADVVTVRIKGLYSKVKL